jgi:hypothetical protein
MNRLSVLLLAVLLTGSAAFAPHPAVNPGTDGKPLYPTDIRIVAGTGFLLANAGTAEVVLYTFDGQPLRTWSFPEPVTGIALHGTRAWVTSSAATGRVTLIDITRKGKTADCQIGAGARAPVYLHERQLICIAEQFTNSVCFLNAATLKEPRRVGTPREPFAMTAGPEEEYLFVNNFLPAQAADDEQVTAVVSVIRTDRPEKVADIPLAGGSNALRGICLSPDGQHVFITHNIGRYQIPTTQLEQGWMNTAGLSILDVRSLSWLATVVLDEPERGAAGSWDVRCTADQILVTHSGTHDISRIDRKALIARIMNEPNKERLAYDLHILEGIRQRIPLHGNGPRAFDTDGSRVLIPTYFSDELNTLSLKTGGLTVIPLNPGRTEQPEDAGHRIFNDATYCFQHWQSCNGCHPGDGRTDGLNWDLLNDGIGNPKNCKSLLFSNLTPPVMVSGIRGSSPVAVRAGFTHIQFNTIPEAEALLVDAYVASLKPQPSPLLVNGRLSDEALAGQKIFEREGCQSCHSGPLFTDLKTYRIGDPDPVNPNWKGWDTPTLREVWRTAPYLFTGSAYRMEEVFTVHRHGLSRDLPETELRQLVEYINSL